MARIGKARYGTTRRGLVRQVWQGLAGRDQARQARSVMAERGAVWTGLAGKAWLGRPRCSKARQVWQGAARSGKAGTDGKGMDRRGRVWFSKAGKAIYITGGNMFGTMKQEHKFLEKLARQNGGVLLVESVLDAAKDPDCVLHKHFQWDDTKAAEAYRKTQARQLIQKCVVTIDKAPNVQIRAFVSLASDQHSGGGYRMTADVLSDDDMKAQLLHDMMMVISRWKRQINLLDHDTVSILDALEDAIATKTRSHRKDGGLHRNSNDIN